MLPGMNGVSLCRQIREESPTPVIMMSARADPVDVVLGLEAGADDYVTKPFDSTVLVARIRAVVRRMGRAAPLPEANGALRCSATWRWTATRSRCASRAGRWS